MEWRIQFVSEEADIAAKEATSPPPRMSSEDEFLIRTLWYHTMQKNNHGIKYGTLPKKKQKHMK